MNIDSSKATVVSICPFPITEFKPGLIPSVFSLPAVADGDIEVLVIPSTIFYRQRVPVLGNVLEIPVPATQLAEAIVKDRMTGQLLYAENSKPGLFWVPGEYTKAIAKVELKVQISEAERMQKSWYKDLIDLADDDWNKHRQHKLISDLQRYAAKQLNVTKEWMSNIEAFTDKQCLACYSPMHPKAIICPTCRTNQEEFVKLRTPVAAVKA